MKIGLLQIHEENHPFMDYFLQSLGYEVIHGKTTRKVVEDGTLLGVNEQCVAAKIALGQAVQLKERCDKLLAPYIKSVRERTWTCPKWLGLPDILKTVVPEELILSPTCDSFPDIGFLRIIKRVTNPTLAGNIAKVRRIGFTPLETMGLELAKMLEIDPLTAIKITTEAQHEQDNFWQKVQKEAFEKYAVDTHPKSVGIIGHPYLLSDNHLNFKLLERISNLGIRVLTADSVPPEVKEEYAKMYQRKPIFWSTHRQLLGALLYWINKGMIDGVIFLTGVMCGPDSAMELVQDRICKESNLMSTRIKLDEHAGEAGLKTRIEAFVDTLPNKRAYVENIPAIIPKKLTLPDNIIASCPNMGRQIPIAVEVICKGLGIGFVKPSPSTEKSFSLAMRYVPEDACRPLVTTTGNMLQTMLDHPETNLLFQGSGAGPCRFGWYPEMHQLILESLGIDAIVWGITPPSEAGIRGFFNSLSALDQFGRPLVTARGAVQMVWETTRRYFIRGEPRSVFKSVDPKMLWESGIKHGYLVLRYLDMLTKEAMLLKTLEDEKAERGATDRALRKAQDMFLEVGPKLEDIFEVYKEARKVLRNIPTLIDINDQAEIDRTLKSILKIGIVGEFYEVLAPESNFDFAKFLGEQGIYAEQGLWAEGWIDPTRKCVVEGTPRKEIIKLASPMLGFCGGDAQETLGHIKHYQLRGFDGVIALKPKGCLPETMAEQMIPYLPTKYGVDIPIFVHSFDEHTGNAGLITRTEAFIDVTKTVKERRMKIKC